ncbi:hypothetical protein HYS48_05315 [Candidatus Woesearchaeota archaeon]|nr:hypothetical protein [Candidatus Woesearchaeota archaeon]
MQSKIQPWATGLRKARKALKQEQKQFLLIVALIFLLSFSIRIYYLNDGLFHYDDVVLAKGMEQMFQEGNFVPGTNIRPGSVLLNYLFYLPYASLTGNTAERIPLLTGAIFSSLAIVLFAFLVWGWFQNRFLTYTATLFFSFSPLYLSQSTMGKEHSMTIFFLLLSLLFLALYGRKHHWGYLAVASLTFVFAVSIRESSLALAPLFLLYGLWLVVQASRYVPKNRTPGARESMLLSHVAALLLPFLLSLSLLLWWYLWGILYNTLFTLRSAAYNPHGTVAFLHPFSNILLYGLVDLIVSLTFFGWFLSIFGMLLSFFVFKKQKATILFLLLWAFHFFYFSNTSGYTSRFLIDILPPFIIFMTLPLSYLYRKRKALALFCVILILGWMIVTAYPLLSYRKDYNGIKAFSLFVGNQTEEQAVVLAMEDARFLEYYGSRATLSHPLYGTPEQYIPWLTELYTLAKEKPVYAIAVKEFNRTALPNYDNKVYNGSLYRLLEHLFIFEEIGSLVVEDYHNSALRFQQHTYYLMKVHPKPLPINPVVYDKDNRIMVMDMNPYLASRENSLVS